MSPPVARPAKPAPRADYGAPVDTYLAAQSEPNRAILGALRTLLEEVAPDMEGAIKWGFPVFEIGGRPYAAARTTRAGVTLLIQATPEMLDDPAGKLTGTAKEMRSLKLTRVEEIDPVEVRGWLQVAADRVRRAPLA